MDKHQKAMDMLKSKLTTDAMSYFDLKKKTRLEINASPVGLAAVLTQYNPSHDYNEKSVVWYLSRALSEVETRFLQVEKEALAVVWACEEASLR